MASKKLVLLVFAVPVTLVILLVHCHLLEMTTSVDLVYPVLYFNYTLMIRCGMAKDVEVMKALVNFPRPGIPWFHKILNSSTTDYIELRVCTNQSPTSEDTS